MITFLTHNDVGSDEYLKRNDKLENLHPKGLRWSNKDREIFFEYQAGKALWIIVNGCLVGELLWTSTFKGKLNYVVAYISSISVIKRYQGQGYSKLLKQVLYNELKSTGYKEVRGHARDGKSWETTKKMGGKLIKTIDNYYETGEKYHYYKQKLK